MGTIEFLRCCTINGFKDWLKDVAIDDSYENIDEDKPFKPIIINNLDLEGEYSYFNLDTVANLRELYIILQSYSRFREEDRTVFELDSGTKLFLYSNKDQLLNSTCKEIQPIIQLLEQDTDFVYEEEIIDEEIIPEFDEIINKLSKKLPNLPKFKIDEVDRTIKFNTDNNMAKFLASLIKVLNTNYIISKILRVDHPYVTYSVIFKDNDFKIYSESEYKDTKFYILPISYKNILDPLDYNDEVYFYILDDIYEELFEGKMHTVYEVETIIKDILKNKDNYLFNLLYDCITDLEFIYVETKEDLDKLLSYKGKILKIEENSAEEASE